MEQVHECWVYWNSNNSKKDHHHQQQQIYKESTSMNSSSTIATWEEKAFAEDAAGHGPLGGCIWPPRSYSCSFCMREFRSAQALGGHMNVHRRDRARLKQCQLIKPNHLPLPLPLPLSRAHQQPAFLSPPPPHDHHHQKLENKIIKMREDGDDDSVWLRAGNHPDDDDDELYNVETDLCVGLNISVASSRTRDEGGFCGDDEDGSSIMSCKRPKITSSFPFFFQSEDNNLDLELRLGDPPKVK